MEYIIELLKNGEFVAKCEDASSIYITTAEGDSMPEGRTNIVFSEVGIEKNPTFWTLETLPFKGDVGKEGKAECHGPYIVVEVYRENPLQLEFWEILEEQHHVGLEIRERTIHRGVLCGQEVECYKAVAGESEYYVRKDVAERYLADAYDFSEWFIDLTEKPGRSKGIICDKKNVYEGLELKEELERVIQGNYTQGDFKILLGYDNSSAELRRIRGALRSVVCRHPLEWDESQFASESLAEEYRMVNRQTAVLSRAQARNLRKAAADIDIWRGGLERVFGRNEFNFYHPLYFLHYLDKAGFLEFNPYESKSNTEKLFVPASWHVVGGIRYGSPGGKVTLNNDSAFNNPGCAPFTVDSDIENYAKLTGIFNEDYINVVRRWNNGTPVLYSSYRTKYHHFGVDFSASPNTKVKSFIYGKVVVQGWISTNGRCLLIQRYFNNYLYLLCHLKGYPPEITEDKDVYPGDIIAYTGTSGATNRECSEDTFSNAPHLHVSVLKYDKKFILEDCLVNVDKSGTSEPKYNWKGTFPKEYVDPFDYTKKWIPTVSIPGKE